jgi:hypothetical protein
MQTRRHRYQKQWVVSTQRVAEAVEQQRLQLVGAYKILPKL